MNKIKTLFITLFLILYASNFFACSKKCENTIVRIGASVCTVACAAPVTYGVLAGKAGEVCLLCGSLGMAGCGCLTIFACWHAQGAIGAICTTQSHPSSRSNQTTLHQTAPIRVIVPPAQIEMQSIPSQPPSEDPTNP